jgi:hypothetical protein
MFENNKVTIDIEYFDELGHQAALLRRYQKQFPDTDLEWVQEYKMA